ncbi:hypothetical protein O3P69_008893 [Scylla paramamosain]|uniref:Small ribosomal subunit protein uS2 n=1 Tax=Scylla paramamosain TaxID=85552 RepID=A0AAW0TP93_SCYPA
MSGGLSVMSLEENDVTRFLAASTHLGANNVNFQMEQYVYKRRQDGTYIIHLRKTYEKILLAARAIAAIENPADVLLGTLVPRPLLAASLLEPSLTRSRLPFREPRLLVVTDPASDHQPITEASYVNIPVIGFCNTDSPLRYVDVAIPCNNKSPHSVGLIWWMLAREVLRLRGTISRKLPWETDVMPDLFFYRDPEEQEKEEAAKAEAAKAEAESAKRLMLLLPHQLHLLLLWQVVFQLLLELLLLQLLLLLLLGAPAAPVDDWGQTGDDWASPCHWNY